MKSFLRNLRRTAISPALLLLLFLLRVLSAAGQDYREDYTPTPPVIDPSINTDVPLPELSPSGGAPFYEWTGSEEIYRDSFVFKNDPADPPLVTYEMLEGKQGAVINLGNCAPTKHYPTFGSIGSKGLLLYSESSLYPYQGVRWYRYDVPGHSTDEQHVTSGRWNGWIGLSSATGEVLSTIGLSTDDILRQDAFRTLFFENNDYNTRGSQMSADYFHKAPTINEWALRNSIRITGAHPDVTGIAVGTDLLHKVILDNLVLPCDGSQPTSLSIGTGVPWWATEAAPPLDIELKGTTRLEGVKGLSVGCDRSSFKALVCYDDDGDGLADGYNDVPPADPEYNFFDVMKTVEIMPPAEYGIGQYTLHGDSLIARFPKTGRGVYNEQGCGKGISFYDGYLTIESCYLEVQGHVQAGKITVKDGVVTAVDPIWIDDYHKPVTPSPMRGFWANETIIDGGSVKVDSFFVTGGELSLENPGTLVTPKNSAGEPVYRVAFAHRGATAVTVTPEGGTAVTRNLRFHHPDDDNYYFFLPDGTYTLAVAVAAGADKDTAYTVTVAGGPNDTHKSGVAGGPPVETGPGPLTPDLDGPPIYWNILPTWRLVALDPKELSASLFSGGDTTITLPADGIDYSIHLSGGSYDPQTKEGTTFFTFHDNNHRISFENTYLQYIAQPFASNSDNSFRHLNFTGTNTVFRISSGGWPFQLGSQSGQPDGARFTGDSLTCGAADSGQGAFVFFRGARLLEIDMDYLHLWGGSEGGISTRGVSNDTVRIKSGVVTLMGDTLGIARTERVIVYPTASLKSQDFSGRHTSGSSSMGGTKGHPVKPVNETGTPVYCVRVPHGGHMEIDILDDQTGMTLDANFTAHHPKHDPVTGAPTTGTDPYYYFYLPNGTYTFSLTQDSVYWAEVSDSDVDAEFVGDISRYASVVLGNTLPDAYAERKVTLTTPEGKTTVLTDLALPAKIVFYGGEKDKSSDDGVTSVEINNWGNEDVSFRNIYAKGLSVSSHYSQTQDRTVHFYGQNTVRTASVNKAISFDTQGPARTFAGDSLTAICLRPLSGVAGNPAISLASNLTNTTKPRTLALDMGYLYVRGVRAGMGASNPTSTYLDTLRIDGGTVTSIGEDFGILNTKHLVIGKKASLKSAAIDGSATGRNALVKKLASNSLTRRKEVAEMLVPMNAEGDTLYCVSVPHGGALTLNVTPEGGSAYSVSFKAHHPQHDAQGLPVAGKVDPNYYLWLPKGTYSITAGAKIFAATVEEADVLAEDVTPPPPAGGGGGGEGPSGGGGGGGGGTATRYVVTFTDGTDILIRFTVTKGSRIPTDSIPDIEREGYTLLHWYSGADIENAWDFETPVSSVLTLSPCWIPYVEPTPDDPMIPTPS
jgi:hypothetical protein